MRYPPFIVEVGLRENRGKLWFSVKSGFGIAVSFGVLAGLAMVYDLIPRSPIFMLPVAMKLATNAFA